MNEDFAIGMTRLSIIDLDTGKQPILSNDCRYHLVCNGEIYNYVELKNKMIIKGYKFKTNSDVEVIIPLFIFFGTGGFQLLDGMFSFALLDTKENELLHMSIGMVLNLYITYIKMMALYILLLKLSRFEKLIQI